MHKQDKEFLHIIDSTPLVSIDLIIKNRNNQVFLGKRTNRPAQHFWFVPGGRIRKNETLDHAVERISMAELGIRLNRKDSRLIGAFDHLYDDNVFDQNNISTHYVALGHEFVIDNQDEIVIDEQHSSTQWIGVDELLTSPDVHENTKAYFR